MTNVVKKVSIGGQVYPFGGGSSEGQEVVYLTQAEYDALPASKLTDGKIYKIKTSGAAPTPGGGTAVERGDIIFHTIQYYSDSNTFYEGPDNSMNVRTFYNNLGDEVYRYNTGNGQEGPCTINGGKLYIVRYNGGTGYQYSINLVNIEDGSESNIYTIPTTSSRSIKFVDYMYVKVKIDVFTQDYNYYKVDYVGNAEASTQSEFDAIPAGAYYKGLYYTQDSNDYVASDVNGTEVKRYSGVGTISGIYDDKLYRNVGDVAYAIATI